jgi:hypothetical protein
MILFNDVFSFRLGEIPVFFNAPVNELDRYAMMMVDIPELPTPIASRKDGSMPLKQAACFAQQFNGSWRYMWPSADTKSVLIDAFVNSRLQPNTWYPFDLLYQED